MSTPQPREFWTIINPDGQPVTPIDGNDHSDQGMLLYFSAQAAEEASAYQNWHYDLTTRAIPLSELNWEPKPGQEIVGSGRAGRRRV